MARKTVFITGGTGTMGWSSYSVYGKAECKNNMGRFS